MRKLFKTIYFLSALFILLMVAITNPVWVNAQNTNNETDTTKLREHVQFLSEIQPARNYNNSSFAPNKINTFGLKIV